MSSSHFFKVIVVVLFGLSFSSCKEKASISLLSVEFVKDGYFDMDVIINLKESYLLHNRYSVVPVGNHSLSPDVFKLSKEETDSLSVLYKAIKLTREKRQYIDKNMLLTYIEAVEGNKIIAQRKQNSKRTEEEKIFLKKILHLIAKKSKTPNAQHQMDKLIKEL